MNSYKISSLLLLSIIIMNSLADTIQTTFSLEELSEKVVRVDITWNNKQGYKVINRHLKAVLDYDTAQMNDYYMRRNGKGEFWYVFTENKDKKPYVINTHIEGYKILIAYDIFTAKRGVNLFTLWSGKNNKLVFEQFLNPPIDFIYAGIKNVESVDAHSYGYTVILFNAKGGDGGCITEHIRIYKFWGPENIKKTLEIANSYDVTDSCVTTITGHLYPKYKKATPPLYLTTKEISMFNTRNPTVRDTSLFRINLISNEFSRILLD